MFSYKVGLKKAAILVVIISGWLIDMMGFNDFLVKKGMMRGVIRNNLQSQSI